MNNLYQEPLIIEVKVLNASVPAEEWCKIEVNKGWIFTSNINQEYPPIPLSKGTIEELVKLIKKIQIPIWYEDTSSNYDEITTHNYFKITCVQYTFECVWMDEDKNEAMDSIKKIADYIKYSYRIQN
jgi:hypothetical protein